MFANSKLVTVCVCSLRGIKNKNMASPSFSVPSFFSVRRYRIVVVSAGAKLPVLEGNVTNQLPRSKRICAHFSISRNIPLSTDNISRTLRTQRVWILTGGTVTCARRNFWRHERARDMCHGSCVLRPASRTLKDLRSGHSTADPPATQVDDDTILTSLLYVGAYQRFQV